MNLLPRAFTKNQQTAVWIDTENNLVHVDAASSKRAEDALALLRKFTWFVTRCAVSFCE